MFSRYFEQAGILFDFFQPVPNIPPADTVQYHVAKYRAIIQAVVRDPNHGFIAGGFFTKYLDGRPQKADVYIRYSGKSNPPTDDELNQLFVDQFACNKAYPLTPSNFLEILSRKEFSVDLSTEFGGPIDVVARITQKNAKELLGTFNYNPARISYSYSSAKFFFDPWFITGGPRNAGSDQLRDRYEQKGFCSDELFSYILCL